MSDTLQPPQPSRRERLRTQARAEAKSLALQQLAEAGPSALSLNGGTSWSESEAAFSTCEGGTYDRASDPWVSIGPDGKAY